MDTHIQSQLGYSTRNEEPPSTQVQRMMDRSCWCCLRQRPQWEGLLTHVKAPTPPEEQKCLIYRVPTNGTQFMLERHGGRRKLTLKSTRSCNEAGPNNAIAEHVWSTGHKILWDETTSIDHDGDWFRWRIKEALYIRSSNAMNSDPGLSLKPWHCCGKLNWLTLNSI